MFGKFLVFLRCCCKLSQCCKLQGRRKDLKSGEAAGWKRLKSARKLRKIVYFPKNWEAEVSPISPLPPGLSYGRLRFSLLFLGQPDDNEIPIADRCVLRTDPGCWVVRDCNTGRELIDFFLITYGFMCELDIRESKPTKNELLTYIQVLRENVKEITKDCKRCKGVDHISMPKDIRE